jgi:hypothetical protein
VYLHNWTSRRPVRRPAIPAPDRDPGGLEIGTDRVAARAGRPFDAPQRPAQSPQRDHPLLFGRVQDIAHGRKPPPGAYRRQRLSSSVVLAGFQVSTSGRFWVSSEVLNTRSPPRNHCLPRAED